VVMGSVGAGGLIAITDDLGRFRIAGLAPGEYYVKALLQTKSQFSMQKGKMNFNFNQLAAEKPLTVFAPAAFRQASAKAVTLTAGQDLDGQEIAINLTNLHSVSGRIASAEDHHSINSGTISLTDASDKDFSRSASVNEDGSFTVRFVPAGTYTLKVEEAADTVPSTKAPGKGLVNFAADETVKSYDDRKQPVIVADDDVMGQSIELTPSATVKKGLDVGGMLGTLMEGSPPPASEKQ
ncbi:MAG TPA: carboxypeptidase-like regulatory domain-containing protein, partial [Acidobacteriaceae bacterium]|nr:carboxypeptidase-like regulatory domain-containing protein [Acidobacteriaceae bacterium]